VEPAPHRNPEHRQGHQRQSPLIEAAGIVVMTLSG
jgi:hypothetical protein